MRRLEQICHAIVTYGEDPDVRGPRGELWVSHLDEFRAEFGFWPWLSELLRGCAAHVWWRVTASEHRSTLPVGAASILVAGASLGLIVSGHDDFLSVSAEAHSAVGLLAIGVALSIHPWALSWRRIAPAAALCASGLLHLAIVNNLFVWFDYVLVAGLIAAGIGLGYIGVSGLRTRKALGATRFGVWAIFAGATTVGLAQFLWALQPTNVVYGVSSLVACWASVFAGLRVLDLWAMQSPPGTPSHRLAGAGRERLRDPHSAERSPLLLHTSQ